MLPSNAVLPHWATLISLRWICKISFAYHGETGRVGKILLYFLAIVSLRHEKLPVVSGSHPAALLHCSWAFSGAGKATFLQSQAWVRLGVRQLQSLGTEEVWAGRGWPWKWLAPTPPPCTHSCKFIMRIFQSNQIHLFRGPLLWWLNLHH